jgi:hypothetical protein
MKEIAELSLYMISSNLSFFSSLLGWPIFRVLNSLMLAFSCPSLWSLILLLSIFLFSFFFSILSTVLFPYIVPLTKQRNAAITRTHRTAVHGKGVMAKKLLFNCFLSFFFSFNSNWWTRTLMFTALEDLIPSAWQQPTILTTKKRS